LADNIEIKTTAQLLDEFVTNQLRCWFAQEDIMNESLPTEKRLDAAIRAQQTNAKRTELIRILDKRLNSPGVTNTTKTYHTYLENSDENN
jgi:hypothetical protein